MKDIQKLIGNSVRAHAGALRTLALSIHRNPELGYEEHQAAAWQMALLRQHGFSVETPVAGLRTAFRAVRGQGKPALAVLSEYDALPSLGHACGHNLICAVGIGTGLVLSDLMRQTRVRGSLVVLGTPGEESRGGKVVMLRKGLFKGIDCALMAHPNWRTVCDKGSTAVSRFRVEFRGQSAHAAAAPELGRNALDALMLLFQGVNAWRQQLPEHARIHGIVLKGGDLPNIIPDFASCVFFLRSTDDRVLAAMTRRFRDIVRGAALMTGTRPTVKAEALPYRSLRTNSHLDAAFMEAASRAGLCPVRPDRTGKGSTDFGDVSQAMPGGHFYFGIAAREMPLHSPQFAQAAGSAYGLNQMLKTVEALSAVGYRYLSDAGFRQRVNAEFRSRSHA